MNQNESWIKMVDMKITVEFSQILGIFSEDYVYMFYVRVWFQAAYSFNIK
jgi:hypothetical protein